MTSRAAKRRSYKPPKTLNTPKHRPFGDFGVFGGFFRRFAYLGETAIRRSGSP